MSAPLILGTIAPTSPRASTWREVFGGDTIPLLSYATVTARLGDSEPQQFYRADVSALTPEQRARLVAHLARRFWLPPAEIEQDLDGPHGLPIWAEDVVVPIPLRLFL